MRQCSTTKSRVGAASKNDEERNEIRSQERTSVAIMSNDEKRNEICHRERISLAMGNEMPALCYVLHQWETESSLGHFAPLYWVKFGGHSLKISVNWFVKRSFASWNHAIVLSPAIFFLLVFTMRWQCNHAVRVRYAFLGGSLTPWCVSIAHSWRSSDRGLVRAVCGRNTSDGASTRGPVQS